MKLTKIAYRNIFRNTKRSILSTTAIAVATGSVLFFFSFIDGMLTSTEYNVKTWITGTVVVQNALYKKYELLNPLHYNIDIKNAREKLGKLKDIKDVFSRTEFPAMIYDSDTMLNHPAMAIGLDLEMEDNYLQLSKNLVQGRLPRPGKREALIGTGLAAKLSKKAGDKFTTFTQTAYRSQNGATYKIAGIVNFPLEGYNAATFLLPLDQAQRLVKMPGRASKLIIHGKNYVKPLELKKEIAEVLPADKYFYRAWIEDEIISMFKQAKSMYDGISFVFLVLAGTVIMNTLMMVIFERIREIGTIGALGMKSREIVRLFLTEGFLMSLGGAIGGLILGMLFLVPLSFYGIRFGQDLNMGSLSFSAVYPRISFGNTLSAFLFSIVVATFISYIAVRRSAKIKPVEALRR